MATECSTDPETGEIKAKEVAADAASSLNDPTDPAHPDNREGVLASTKKRSAASSSKKKA